MLGLLFFPSFFCELICHFISPNVLILVCCFLGGVGFFVLFRFFVGFFFLEEGAGRLVCMGETMQRLTSHSTQH